MRFLLIAIFAISVISTAAQSSEGLPFPFPDEINGKTAIGQLPKQLTAYGKIVLGQSTFEQVKATYGNATTFQDGNGNHAISSVCYLSSNGDAVVFQSGLFGNWSIVTNMLFAKGRIFKNKDCLQNDDLTRPVGLGGIVLGLGKKSVTNLLGAPAYSDEHLTEYVYDTHDPEALINTSAPPKSNIFSGIRLSFDADGKLQALEVYWIEESN